MALARTGPKPGCPSISRAKKHTDPWLEHVKILCGSHLERILYRDSIWLATLLVVVPFLTWRLRLKPCKSSKTGLWPGVAHPLGCLAFKLIRSFRGVCCLGAALPKPHMWLSSRPWQHVHPILTGPDFFWSELTVTLSGKALASASRERFTSEASGGKGFGAEDMLTNDVSC